MERQATTTNDSEESSHDSRKLARHTHTQASLFAEQTWPWTTPWRRATMNDDTMTCVRRRVQTCRQGMTPHTSVIVASIACMTQHDETRIRRPQVRLAHVSFRCGPRRCHGRSHGTSKDEMRGDLQAVRVAFVPVSDLAKARHGDRCKCLWSGEWTRGGSVDWLLCRQEWRNCTRSPENCDTRVCSCDFCVLFKILNVPLFGTRFLVSLAWGISVVRAW